MKIDAVLAEHHRIPGTEHCLVHSGQLYDEMLSGKFFEELKPAGT